MSCRCHRSSVSGVTTVASSRNRPRPNRYARTASRRRSSSVNCRRRPRSWRRSTRFSSSRYRRTSRSWRSDHPAKSVSSNGTRRRRSRPGIYITGRKSRIVRRFNHGTVRPSFTPIAAKTSGTRSILFRSRSSCCANPDAANEKAAKTNTAACLMRLISRSVTSHPY